MNIDVTGANARDNENSLQKELYWLMQPGNLEARMRDMDKNGALERIFVMGCGRSGTWLLTAAMSTFRDVYVDARELPVEYFGIMSTTQPLLVLKRTFDSFRSIENIPDAIKIAYIVRHPFDVLTSHNPTTGHQYHIEPYRWLGEMLALQYLIDTQRKQTKIIRYEDLVSNPDAIQAELGAFFNLQVAAPMSDLARTFQASPEARAAMHGVRPIDRNSLYRYRNRPEHLERLCTIRPRLGRTLDWVAQEFGYDISL